MWKKKKFYCYDFSRVDSNLKKAIKIYPLPHMYIIKDLVPVSPSSLTPNNNKKCNYSLSRCKNPSIKSLQYPLLTCRFQTASSYRAISVVKLVRHSSANAKVLGSNPTRVICLWFPLQNSESLTLHLPLPWCPWNAPVEIKNFLKRCPLSKRKCIGALALSKTKHTGLTYHCFIL